MAPSRYSKYPRIQPTRIIPIHPDDIIKTMSSYDNLDTWADKYYDDPTLSWVIMCANPQYTLEFDIPAGAKVRIPMPIERVWEVWGEQQEV